MNALLLCAGLGTRFRPLTDKMAKPAIEFLGVPLLGFSLFYLEQLGLKNLVLNTHHLASTIETVAKELSRDQSYRVQFSHEPEILGSGGGIKQAEKLLAAHDDFIVANGDEVVLFAHDRGLAPLLEFHKKNGALATLLTTAHPDAGRSLGGVWSDGGRISKLGGAGENALHFTGFFVFSPRIFSFMPRGQANFHIFKDCLTPALARGETILNFHDPDLLWLDISSQKDFDLSSAVAQQALDAKTLPSLTLQKILARFGV